MGFLTGKRFLITGIASNRSIATGIAHAMFRQGAELAFTYQNEKLQSRVAAVAAECNSQLLFPCDVADDANITLLFDTLKQSWPTFDGFIHAIAYAPSEQLEGNYLEAVNREGFRIAHDISAYSFAALAKGCQTLLTSQAALLTLSYLGAERAIPHYNVMGLAKASLEANVRYLASAMGDQGVRVNGVSAGPVRTLAAAGIKDFKKMLAYFEAAAPIGRTVTLEDIGNTAAFLCSDLAAGITGEIVHVDGGFSTTAMNRRDVE
jgi:enoyl-[acyl-carrier protein] reductase I